MILMVVWVCGCWWAGTLCAFFRNNHFSTMLKKDGRLYLLVTDTGYAGEASVVWELLDEIDGYGAPRHTHIERRHQSVAHRINTI
jgi:hypothetical protein